jgi:putative glutamine amidotransferase
MTRPVIGIEVDIAVTESGRRYAKVYETYCDAVSDAGGAPILLPPMPDGALDAALGVVSGLLLPGGDDLAADLWGEVQRPCPRFVAVDARRLDHGRRLLAAARARDLAVLGVCYGAQLLSLVRGGAMVQDIPDELPGAMPHSGEPHPVEVAPGTLLARLLGAGRVEVNSRHHQSVRGPGDGLGVSARAPDGVIEAVEAPGERFVLGVQWHPEDLGPLGAPLFRGLVDAARRGLA